MEGVNDVRFPSSHGQAFSSFHTSFGGFAEVLHPDVSAFTDCHLLEVVELNTPRHWPSFPHLHNMHPMAILSASAGAHKTGIPTSGKPQLNRP